MVHVERRSVVYSQNFLRSGRLVDRLLDRSSIGPGDLVWGIGPGRGRITERLARRCRQVVAIEKDPGLVVSLRRRFAGTPNVAVREGDFLRCRLPDGPYKVFASIPFNVTTEIVTRLTAAPRPPDDAYLVVQREAAGRIVGGPRESLYGLLLKPWFEPSVVHRFRRTDFDPAPRVDAVMLRLRKRGPLLIGAREARLYRDFVAYGFTAWRPSLLEALAGLLGRRGAEAAVRSAGVDPGATPSSVCFEQWLCLFGALQAGDGRLARCVGGAEERLRRRQRGLRKVHQTRVTSTTGRTTAGRAAKAERALIDDCRPPPSVVGRGPRRRAQGGGRETAMRVVVVSEGPRVHGLLAELEAVEIVAEDLFDTIGLRQLVHDRRSDMPAGQRVGVSCCQEDHQPRPGVRRVEASRP